MKKTKKIICTMLAGAMVIAAPMSALAEEEEKKEMKNFSVSIDATLKASVAGTEEETQDIDVKLTAASKVRPEEFVSYTTTEILSGDEAPVKTEIYTKKDGDFVKTYASDDGGETWTTDSVSLEEFQGGEMNINELFGNASEIPDILGEASGDDIVNGTICLKYTKEIGIEELKEIIDATGDEIEAAEAGMSKEDMTEMLSTYLDGLKINVEYYANAETQDPVRLILDASESELEGLKSLGQALVDETFDFDLETAVITMDFDYDDVVVEIPEDVIEKAESERETEE